VASISSKLVAAAVLIAAAITSAAPACAGCDADRPTRTPTSRYVIGGGEVYDKKSDLTWKRCSTGQRWKEGAGCVGVIKPMTWDEAMKQASDGWRVPSKDELLTLVSPTCHGPAINEEAFPDMELDKLWYWTSSEDGAFLAWLVDFAEGHPESYDRTDTGTLRLVRDGQHAGG
jgi:hypothetical protein